jgi:single-strand DNA-binding protein
MSGVNKVILIGRLGRDPEIRTFENGSKKAIFSIATSENYKDRDGNKIEQTEWHNIACWRNLAEAAEKYLTKGKLIYLEGRLRTRSWEDNGAKKYITEIEASTFMMLGAKNDEGGTLPSENRIENQQQAPPPATEPEMEVESSDDLPF